ncbi:MAG: GGDEF domain-containing protein [Pseudomonadota bacterium]
MATVLGCSLFVMNAYGKDASTIDDPGAFLAQTESLRIRDHEQFARQLALIHREAPSLTPAQHWYLKYLDAYEATLQGDYDAAESPLRQVIDQSGDTTLAAKASALLMSNMAMRHRYLEAFALAHKLTTYIPQITDVNLRNDILGNLSQMFTLAGQADLAIQYARMMQSGTSSEGESCKARFRLLAAQYSAKRLTSSDPKLEETVNSCAREHEPIVQAATQLMRTDLQLGEHKAAQALASLDRIAPAVARNHYYPHTLSEQVQRAEAYEQLGDLGKARQLALGAIGMASPDDIDNWLAIAYRILFDDAKRRSDFSQALSYYEKYVRQQRRSVDDAAAQALAYQTVQQQVMARKLEAEELSKQNSVLKLQKELDAKAVETSRLYITLLLIGLTGIVLLLLRIKHSQLRFKRMAALDGLTGILNHQNFITESERALLQIEKKSTHASLIWMDLDHFKKDQRHVWPQHRRLRTAPHGRLVQRPSSPRRSVRKARR